MGDDQPGRAPGPAGGNRTYRHEALLWHDMDDFLACTVPFVRTGLEAGEAVMVSVIESRAQWLHKALGPAAADVLFVDMGELGRNPARILPAWRQFLDEHPSGVRGIGEPIWNGRRPEEIVEGQLHEALLNVAVTPDTPFWLLCPYEVSRLEDRVIDQVYRSHPAVLKDQQYRGSHLYAGRELVEEVWSSELPTIPGTPTEMSFDRDNLQQVSAFVTARAIAAEVSPDLAAALAVVVQQLAGSSVQRAGAGGTVRFWRRFDALIVEVHDIAMLNDPLAGRRAAGKNHRNALWHANELCDLVQVRSTASGTTVRIHHWL